jgi:TP901 family phage tail tape measure protein
MALSAAEVLLVIRAKNEASRAFTEAAASLRGYDKLVDASNRAHIASNGKLSKSYQEYGESIGKAKRLVGELQRDHQRSSIAQQRLINGLRKDYDALTRDVTTRQKTLNNARVAGNSALMTQMQDEIATIRQRRSVIRDEMNEHSRMWSDEQSAHKNRMTSLGTHIATLEKSRAGIVANATATSRWTKLTYGLTAALKIAGAAAMVFVKIATSIGIIATAGIAYAVNKASQLDSKISELGYTTQATSKEMAAFRQRALELGRDITLPGVSANDAADAFLEMARAGMKVNDVLAAGKGVLALSVAAQMDFGDSARLTATMLNAFKLKGEDATHVANLLAGASAKSTLELKEIMIAAQQSNSAFARYGHSVEDMSTAMAMMADSGLRGEKIGTTLKVMFERLAAPTAKASAALKALNINVWDSHGKMNSMPNLIQQFTRATKGMTDQQIAGYRHTIFGTRANAASQIILEQGIGKWNNYAKAVNGSVTATGLAQASMDPFKTALENVKNVTEDLATEIGTDLKPTATAFINWIGEEAIPWMKEWWQEHWPKLKEAVKSFADYFKAELLPRIKDAWKFFQDNLKPSLDSLVSTWNNNKESIIQLAKNIGKVIIPILLFLAGVVLKEVIDTLKALIDIVGWVGRAFNALWNTIIDVAKGIFNAITVTVEGIIGAFAKIPGPTQKAFQEAAKSVKDFRIRGNEELEKFKNRDVKIKAGIEIKGPSPADWRKVEGWGGTPVKRAMGGGVFGAGTSTSDSIPALLSNNEHVWTAEETAKAGGHAAMERARSMAKSGALKFARGGAALVQRFAGGGPAISGSFTGEGIGRLANSMNALNSNMTQLATVLGRRAANQVKKNIEEGMGGLGGGIVTGQVAGMMRVLRSVFPGLALISGQRYGAAAITATGRPSYHGKGRAVDVPQSMAVFNWIRANFGGRTKELIFSPAGGRQIHNGQPHMYTGVTRGDHWDHVHWAFKRGGRAIKKFANGGMINERIIGLGESGQSYEFGEQGPERVSPVGRGRARHAGDINVTVHTNEIDPRRNAAQLAWEIAVGY